MKHNARLAVKLAHSFDLVLAAQRENEPGQIGKNLVASMMSVLSVTDLRQAASWAWRTET